MIDALIFSRDRAMQLDALLTSIAQHAEGVFDTATVLYHASGAHYDLAYLDCLRAHPWATPVPEVDFREDVRSWVGFARDRACFLCDDDVFYRPVPQPIPSATLLSFRLGLNTTRCYTSQDCEQALPADAIIEGRQWFAYEWQHAAYDFGYPMSLDGHVYNAMLLRPALDFPFKNPTQLEAGLAGRAYDSPFERIVAPNHSVLVSLPLNRVSETGGCRHHGGADYLPGRLNERYLNGQRIDLAAMDFSSVTAAHQEIGLAFRHVHARLSA